MASRGYGDRLAVIAPRRRDGPFGHLARAAEPTKIYESATYLQGARQCVVLVLNDNFSPDAFTQERPSIRRSRRHSAPHKRGGLGKFIKQKSGMRTSAYDQAWFPGTVHRRGRRDPGAALPPSVRLRAQ